MGSGTVKLPWLVFKTVWVCSRCHTLLSFQQRELSQTVETRNEKLPQILSSLSLLGATGGVLKCDPGSWSWTCGCRLQPGTHTGREVCEWWCVCSCVCERTSVSAVMARGLCPAAMDVSMKTWTWASFQCQFQVEVTCRFRKRSVLYSLVFHTEHIKVRLLSDRLCVQCMRWVWLLTLSAAMRQVMLICEIHYTSAAASIRFKWNSLYFCVFNQSEIHPHLQLRSPSSGCSPKGLAVIYLYFTNSTWANVYGRICLMSYDVAK